MKIGIIVHSITGNTLSDSEKIQQRLQEAGHAVSLVRIRPIGKEPVQNEAAVRLEQTPDLSGFEALVFGSPVQAFSLDPVMSAFLKQTPDLGGRKTVCFLTQQLSFRFFAGNRSIKKMQSLCEARHGAVCLTGIVNWSHKERSRMIDDLVQDVARQF